MEYNGNNLCDFCFEPVSVGTVCSNCGLSHESYRADSSLLLPGTLLSKKYVIGRVLGRGGFGATYIAFSLKLGKSVAIKEYFPTGIVNRAAGKENVEIVSDDKRIAFDKGAKCFFDEARILAKFNSHKNIVSVYDFFYSNDTVYYSMEYLRGVDLNEYVKINGGKLNENETVAIMKGVCVALVAVHSEHIIHKDISPDNIFICSDGNVKLIDFGAAKYSARETDGFNHSALVTQGFAPPEQYNSTGRHGAWTDIYALGASMYYALTGVAPLDAMSRIENPEIKFPTYVDVSSHFAVIIKKCLEYRIQDRYQNANELLAELDKLDTNRTYKHDQKYLSDNNMKSTAQYPFSRYEPQSGKNFAKTLIRKLKKR